MPGIERESFQWSTFWYKDRDNLKLHTISIPGECYDAIPINGCVHLAGSFADQLN